MPGSLGCANRDAVLAEIARRKTGQRLCLERLAEVARARKAVTPGQVGGLGDADTRTRCDLHVALARREVERRHVERQSVMRLCDPERFGKAAGAGTQEPRVEGAAAALHRR